MTSTVLTALVMHLTVPSAKVVPVHTVVPPDLNTTVCPPSGTAGLPPVNLALSCATFTSSGDVWSRTGLTESVVGPLLIVTVSCFVAVAGGLNESVTWTVKVDDPTGSVGIPLMVPSAASARPAGRLPEANDQA